MTVALAGDDDPEGCTESVEGEKSEINDKSATMSRKEKRKALKKMKRRQVRRETAMRDREEEEARLNDPEERVRQRQLEQAETERMERDRKEFEERERRFLEELELKRKREEEDEEQRRLLEEEQRKQVEIENQDDPNGGSDWEYVEEGPAEIIWQGNEIIVRKKKVRVPKKDVDQQITKEDIDRPISNPLAPQSEAFEDYKNAQELLESVAQQVPNFGTEQDKAHCPFHLKTGACRFGARCSRVHFYPDKSCTMLMKNMYSGPGLAWEHDEGLEYTDEEVEHCFEDFYEDVHTEFLKFGEIVNFKVCNNACAHLRGNVYVHYKSLESAVLAYHSINGRYFAGKQVTCEFVNVTRWRVAICGEYMKSRLKTCSRGSACNFIHCFRNPGGDYEWADWDKPPPRYWVKKMAALFGYTDEYDKQSDEGSPGRTRSSTKTLHANADSYHPRRSRSRELLTDHYKSHYDVDVDWKAARESRRSVRKTNDRSKRVANLVDEIHEERMSSKAYPRIKSRKHDSDSDVDSNENDRYHSRRVRSSWKRKRNHGLTKRDGKSRAHETDSDRDWSDVDGRRDSHHEHISRKSKIINDHEDSMGKPRNLGKKQSLSPEDIVQGRSMRHKTTISVHHDIDSDVSEMDSQRDGDERYEERHRSHSRRSTDQAKSSHGGSRGYSIDRDEGRYHKHSKRDSASGKELSFSEIDSLEETLKDGVEHSRHRRRSSRQQNKEYDFSDIDSHSGRFYRDKDRDRGRSKDGDSDRRCKKMKCTGCEDSIQGFEGNPPYQNGEYAEHANKGCENGLEQKESEAEQDEQAYRQAALEKLEEKRRLKDFVSVDCHEKLGTHKSEVTEERVEATKQFPNSKDVEGYASSRMRRRI
ncbi:hypothetical protein Ancab_003265 [Ancistrocladus abbreviatus]